MNKLINYLPLLAASLIISGCADSNQNATTGQGAGLNNTAARFGTTGAGGTGYGATGVGGTGNGGIGSGGTAGGGVQGGGH